MFLPFHAWGPAALIAVGTLVLASLGQAGDVGVGAITTEAVMVIGALSPHDAWQQPIIGAVDTVAGVAIGLVASWLANGNLVDGVRRQPG